MDQGEGIGIIACDMRQIYMTRMLREKGYQVMLWDQREEEIADQIFQCPQLILPVPVSRMEHMDYFLDGLKGSRVRCCYGGVFSQELTDRLKALQVEVVDVLQDSQVAAENAIATGEGCIATLMKMMPINVEGASIILLGFGKCGKIIAEKLYCLGARVTVVARRDEVRNLAGFFGFETYDFHEDIPYEQADGLINTVPARVVDKEAIDRLSPDAVIVDIASAPGGCDGAYCKEKGVPYQLALGLPGKYSPKTSGEILLRAMPF